MRIGVARGVEDAFVGKVRASRLTHTCWRCWPVLVRLAMLLLGVLGHQACLALLLLFLVLVLLLELVLSLMLYRTFKSF